MYIIAKVIEHIYIAVCAVGDFQKIVFMANSVITSERYYSKTRRRSLLVVNWLHLPIKYTLRNVYPIDIV